MTWITSIWAPRHQPKYYFTPGLSGGWWVMERVRTNEEFRAKRHSWHDTKDQAKAVAHALNELTQ